jgi:hypothetical protein
VRDLERQRRHGYYRNTVLGPASNHALDPDRLTHIYRKLDVGNRVAALAKLRRLGWKE